MKGSNAGQFVISLDFELMWGVRDKKTIESYGANLRGVRKVIPGLLQLFNKYGINATFATVGFLFASTRQELLSSLPALKPNYSNPAYSPYENDYLQTLGESEEKDIYHYAASLLDMIRNYENQEIATHTYCHYYCLEGASLHSFEEDIKAAIRVAKEKGDVIKSIIFPRNQYSDAHIDICKKLGIIAYRGNEKSSIYHPRKNEEQSKKIRALRLLDTYFNLTGHNTAVIKANEGVVNIPSSRFLRPYSKKLKALEYLRLKRIKNSLTYAAKNGETYHLWWHPHNFGKNLIENLQFLEAILQHYQVLNQQYGFTSKSMKEIAAQILTSHEG